MASFDPQDFGLDDPPPRPTTPPVRRGFLLVLMLLLLAATLVYGIPYVAEQTGYAWESGRARAATEALAKLSKDGTVARVDAVFRLATTAVSPAVVNIQAVKFRKDQGAPGLPFGGGQNRFGPGGAWESFGIGSGVIVDREQGFIVTNNHVINGADQITVRLSQGVERKAKLVGADPKTDLAVLQIPGPLRVAADWGDSDKLSIGDWVLAIGSPFMLDHTVTHGIISATGRNNLNLPGLEEGSYQDFLQTDAPINPGNSGGPLIDLNGKVIGINTAILTGASFRGGEEGMSQSGGFEGIGLAIPSSMAKRITEGLIKNGRVSRGYLGVMPRPLSPELARQFKSPDARGAFIEFVQPDSPAARAGLTRGDIIAAIDGKEVVDPATLRNRTAGIAPGTEVTVDYLHDGEKKSVKLVLAELPEPSVASLNFGISVRDIPLPDGQRGVAVVVDNVARGSLAFSAGLRPGMRVTAVGETEVHNRVEFEKAIETLNPTTGLSLQIQAPGGRTFKIDISPRR